MEKRHMGRGEDFNRMIDNVVRTAFWRGVMFGISFTGFFWCAWGIYYFTR